MSNEAGSSHRRMMSRLASVQTKILAACVCFVVIIMVLGTLAQRQTAEMGRLAISIYDHSFNGMAYVSQAEEEFLRFAARQNAGDAAQRSAIQKVADQLAVALERATTERTIATGKQALAALEALRDSPAAETAKRLAAADTAITRLVKRFAADGLEARDAAEETAAASAKSVLIEIIVAVAVAIGVGWVVGRDLSRPLVQLVRVIGGLAAGNLDQQVTPKLLRRRDEIGQVARAAAVFREAMEQNARASGERERMKADSESARMEALRHAADRIEVETNHVAEKSANSSAQLNSHAADLTASAARVLVSVGAVTAASNTALERSQLVAAAGEELSASAREIAKQIAGTTVEINSTAQAGERARQIMDELSRAVGDIGAVARLIGDIAGRTNLLALNATIEAAHAGDAGRGFAVVASEVKSLAAQTASSTQEISRNATSIERATQDAVQVVREMVERVAALSSITGAVADAAEQQTAATGEIARNVTATAEAMRAVAQQIDAVTDEARQTESAASELYTLTADVGDRIGELREVMIRITRTSSDAADRRRHERLLLEEPASLIVDGQIREGICLDLGLGGARVRVAEPVDEQTGVSLRLRGMPELTGDIVTGGEMVSMHFNFEPEDAPPELSERLRQLAAA